MSKGLRLSERWFERGLWVIAIVFAGFLIGLGRLVVNDLPKVNRSPSPEMFVDQTQLAKVHAKVAEDRTSLKANQDATDTAALNTQHANEAVQAEQSSFESWVATRSATEQASQNEELVRRTQHLDEVKAEARHAQQVQDQLESARLQLQQMLDADIAHEQSIRDAGLAGYERAARRDELKVFLMRLAITLPLLLIAGFLFVKARRTAQWPFVWGFIFFALFAFFVELVPYLPSYGGYVRYIVGVITTVIVGNYAIRALQRYIAQQKKQEQRPEEERRKDLSYEVTQLRLSKRVCPGCERPFDVADPNSNVCMHCGLLVFSPCPQCGTRQNVFTHFCRMCGLAKMKDSTN